jgi:hypothetical protein
MNPSRLRLSHPYGETPPNVYSDFEWIRLHEKELLEQFGECSIIVYNEKVIGIGETYAEAVEDAERNLPPDSGEITPVHQWLYHRNPVLRVRNSKQDAAN